MTHTKTFISEIYENDIYDIDNMILEKNKEKTEYCKRDFESELKILD